MERHEIERQGGRTLGRRLTCVCAAILMVATYGLTAVTGTAGAATPLPAPTGLTPNGGDAGPNPVLRWNAVSGAAYYRVTHPDQNGNSRTDTVYATSYATNLDYPLGPLSWSVTAYDQANQPGAAANATFKNAQAGGPTLTCTPTVNFPKQSPEFSWDAVDGAKDYTLEVSTTDTFVPASTQTYRTQSTSYTLTRGVPDDQTYFSRVSATTYSGVNTAASELCSYKVVWSPGQTDANDAKPRLTSPADKSHVRDVVLRWESLLGAASYEVQVSPNGDWTNNLYYDIITDSTTWSPAKTLDNASFFWRVRGIDNAGNFSLWSDPHQFTVDSMDAPVLLSPANGELEVDNFLLSWAPVDGAGAYEVQIDTDQNFSNFTDQGYAVAHTCLTTHTEWGPYTYENPPGQFPGPGGYGGCPLNVTIQAGRTDGVPLFWRVRALDHYTQNELTDPWNTDSFRTPNRPPVAAINGQWSSTFKFEYHTRTPFSAPSSGQSQVGPPNGASVTVPRLSWNAVPGTKYYLVTIYRGGNIVWSAKTAATNYVPALQQRADLPPTAGKSPISYTWRVQAVDYNERVGPMPPARSFTWSGFQAGTSSPISPIGDTPGDGDTVTGIPTFSWTPVAGADHYVLAWFDSYGSEIYTPITDDNRGGNQANPIAESFTPTRPLPAGEHAWMIFPYDAHGNRMDGQASAKFHITVDPGLDPAVPNAMSTRIDATHVDTCDGAKLVAGCNLKSTPLLSWDRNDQASFYRVVIALDPNFTNTVRVYDTAQTDIRPVEALPDNQAGQSYYWFVQSCTVDWRSNGVVCGPNDSSVWTSPYLASFHKQSKAITGLKVIKPDIGAGDEPSSLCNGTDVASEVSDVLTFCWNEVDPSSPTIAPYSSGGVGAMSYHIQVSTTQDFSNIIDQAWVDQPSYTPYEWPQRGDGGYVPGSVVANNVTFPNHKTYPDGPIYWRVQAVDATNNGLTYSTTQHIEKKSTPVILSTPADDGSPENTPSLGWQPKTFAARYEVQVARNGDRNFSGPNLAFDQFTDLTSITPTNNNRAENGTSLPAGTYAWRVRGVDADNHSGAWSTTWTFTVDPAVPTLTSPANDRMFSELANMAFTWSPVDGAVRYRIWISRNNPPTSGGFLFDTVSTSWSLDRPLANGTYYWMVQTLDTQNQVLATSAVRSFKLLGTRPTVTNLRATASVYKAIDLSWGSSNDSTVGPITGFTINRYSSSTATTPSATRNVSASTSTYRWTDLDANTRYYFTVTANDQYGPGPESNRATAVAPGYTAVQSFVYAAYNDFLGRNPTSSQLNAATAYLGANPTATRKADWLQALANSPAWVNAIVNQFYLDTLGRAGEPGGVTYWSGQITSRQKTVAEVASSFYASDEYFDGQYGQSNLTTWVRDLYAKILNRAPDSGVAYWVSAVSVHANPNPFAGRLWVAYNFYQSQESRQKRVTDLYQKLLHRDPDHGGLLYWAGRILDEGDIALAVNLASSNEYYSRAQTRYPG